MEPLSVKIEKLVYGGDGLGHSEGLTVFVPYVLPGEVVRVEPFERKMKFVRGRLLEVVAESPARVAPKCPHFGVCGGCYYQHIPYPAQIQYKAEILRETLRRIGRVEWTGAIETHSSPPFAYRNRAQWKLRSATGQPSSRAIGYFQAGTAVLTPVQECQILSPRLAGVLDSLRELLAQNALSPNLQEVEAFTDESGPRVLLNVSFARSSTAAPVIAQTLRAAIPEAETILLHDSARDRFELDGPGYIQYEALGQRFRVGHLSFFQTNRFLIDDLARAVAGEDAGKLAIDLFAGVGLFTLALIPRFEHVVAVDSNLAAIHDLSANIQAAGAAAEPVNLDAESFLQRTQETPDLIVLDPPRAGASPKTLSRILEMRPPRITYLSCDPATLARDLAILSGGPNRVPTYHIREIHLFDIFPQTYHIEALVRLERRG
jgi:23S rRNA (uracil1939-C5)-methyltransferase